MYGNLGWFTRAADRSCFASRHLKNYICVCLCVCEYACAYVLWHTCRNQKTTHRSWFLLPIMKPLCRAQKSNSSAAPVAGAFACWAILPAQEGFLFVFNTLDQKLYPQYEQNKMSTIQRPGENFISVLSLLLWSCQAIFNFLNSFQNLPIFACVMIRVFQESMLIEIGICHFAKDYKSSVHTF